MAKYNHLMRKNYVFAGNYRWESYPIPHWMTIAVNKSWTGKTVVVHSTIHADKKVKIGSDYSLDWSDQEILKDISPTIHNRYLA